MGVSGVFRMRVIIIIALMARGYGFWPPLRTLYLSVKTHNTSVFRPTVGVNAPWRSAFYSAKRAEDDAFKEMLNAKQDPSERAEDVVYSLFFALQWRRPAQGLGAMIGRSSPLNGMRSQPFKDTLHNMENGKYQILLGNFNAFYVNPVHTNDATKDETTRSIRVTVVATVSALNRCGVPRLCRSKTLVASMESVTFCVDLHNPTGGRWLFDTLYYVCPTA